MNSKRVNLILALVMLIILSNQQVHADFVFGIPKNCGPTVNTAYGEHGASVSMDGLTLYFSDGGPFPSRPNTSGGADIWVTTREKLDSPWVMSEGIGAPINSPHIDATPCISPDGLSLYFVSDRPGGFGAEDIYVSTRSGLNSPWEDPINLGAGVNSSSLELFPSISPDGLIVYFCSFRSGNGDIFVATRTSVNEQFHTAENVGPIVNTLGTEENCPYVLNDGCTLFFSFHGDLFMSRRFNGEDPWGDPVNLRWPVNTNGGESGTSLTADGTRLFFHGSHVGTGYGNTDLWEAEVIHVVDFNSDGIVNAADVCIMVDNWGTDNPLCDIGPTPFGDGVVDVQDLIVLAEHLFEETTPAE